MPKMMKMPIMPKMPKVPKMPKISKMAKVDEVVKSPSSRHPGERRGPEQPEKTGFRLPPE
jgi:hypothetical protein